MTCRCVAPVDVTLYRMATSTEGTEARAYFARRGVACEDRDITSDPAAQEFVRTLSGQTERPVVVVDGRTFVGYDPSALDEVVPSNFPNRGRR